MAQDASKPVPEPSRPRFWYLQAWILMAFSQNADPFLDGFGIILTMQIPSRLHVIEASKAFSKMEFLKELPVCSTIRGKIAEFAFSFQLKILSSIPCLREPAEQANTPRYVPAMARGLPKPLKEKSLKYI